MHIFVPQGRKLNLIPDFDPEVDDIPDGSSNSDASSDDEAAADGARDLYVGVEKSQLRKPKTAALGPQYRGSKVSRDIFTEVEDEDDPFSRGFEDEGSSEEVDVSEGLSGVDGRSAEDEDSSLDAQDMADGTSDTDFSDDGVGSVRPNASGMVSGDARDMTVKTMTKDQKVVASSLARSTKVDAEKGRAVKKQRATFDSLLSTRIKLQQSLIGANTIVGTPGDELHAQWQDAKDAIDAAETAAFKLWSSLDDFREEIGAARTSQKRKRSLFTSSSSTEDLWDHMQVQEESNIPHRNATLQRWSAKTRDTSGLAQQGPKEKNQSQTSIVDALQEQLSHRERLLRRAHTPRSCAPLQLANKVTEDKKIYDDVDFYGLLLKELLEQKSQDSVAASNIDIDFSLRREAKTKKNVDTKASKGRRLRYTVHEKLQNFMAPEDRSTWGERQMDELFGSLFGVKLGLGEDLQQDEEIENAVDDEDAGLMMFKN